LRLNSFLPIAIIGIRAYVQLDFKFSKRWELTLCPGSRGCYWYGIIYSIAYLFSHVVDLHVARNRTPPEGDLYASFSAKTYLRNWIRRRFHSALECFDVHSGCWLEWTQKSIYTVLAFEETGSRLASGSQGTEFIVWDVLAGTGLSR
jgi:hypothetical protein